MSCVFTHGGGYALLVLLQHNSLSTHNLKRKGKSVFFLFVNKKRQRKGITRQQKNTDNKMGNTSFFGVPEGKKMHGNNNNTVPTAENPTDRRTDIVALLIVNKTRRLKCFSHSRSLCRERECEKE